MNTTAQRMAQMRQVVFTDGAIEALKWLGALVMVGDHINKYLLGDRIAPLYALGRLALPLFGIVFAYNLARRDGAARATWGKLSIAGVVATPLYVTLGQGMLLAGWWPLNILFMLLAAAVVIDQLEKPGAGHKWLAIGAFLVGGAFVEYWWPAIAMIVGAWLLFRNDSVFGLVVSIGGLLSLYFINGNHFAMLALVVLAVAARFHVDVPRVRWFFYVFYPAQLFAIWLCRII